MIKSADSEVRSLIAALSAEESARREAAIARLIIIGGRAVARLATAYDSATERRTQLAILRVLEASGDVRAMAIARRGLAAGGDLAVAAVGVLRELLTAGAGSTHAEALDLLLALSTDVSVERRVRAAAAQALGQAPDDIRQVVGQALPPGASEDDALWEAAAEGRLPDNPADLRESMATRAATAPLPVLRRLIEAVRDRERAKGSAPEQREWQAVRGALHQALALRGSRIALYDLRESVGATTDPLPPSFLAALTAVGDDSCLEPLAAAFTHAPPDSRWRHQLAETFHAVVRRERLTKKHSAVRRALSKAPALSP